MKKSWIVNSVSHSPLLGLKGTVLGIYASEDAAKEAVHADIERWRSLFENEGVEVDFANMAAYFDYDTDDGRKWFVTQIETP